MSIFYKEIKAGDQATYQSKTAEVKIYGAVKTGKIEGRRKSIKGALSVSQKVNDNIGSQE